MQPIVMKIIRVPLGVIAKVELVLAKLKKDGYPQSFNGFAVEALREKVERLNS